MSRALVATLLSAALSLGGCASVASPNPADPFEGYNRSMQGFNDAVDDAVLKPVATAYQDYVPEFVRIGVRNFFFHLEDAWSAVNHGLQGKLEPALNMSMRFGFNTVFGLGGFIDLATPVGLERLPEDFGQTLGRWGVPPGPYLVLPLLGPSTVRDTAGLPLDWTATSITLVTRDGGIVYGSLVLDVVETRSSLLAASRLLDDIALDRYSFLRDAYLARRRNLVYDGEPPEPQD
jgi:phospholipid-binding lipoprotein MlaA